MSEEDSMYNLPPHYYAIYASFCELLTQHHLRPSEGITIGTTIISLLMEEIEKEERFTRKGMEKLLQIQIDYLIDLKKDYEGESNE